MKLTVLMLILASLSLQARSAEISIQTYDPQIENIRQSEEYNFGRPFIFLDGEIVLGDYERIQQEARNLIDMNVPLVLRLNSPGGSVSEALKIADFVRASWTTTWIQGKSIGVDETDRTIATCDSACALIFFSGIERRYPSSNWRSYNADDPYIIPMENRPPDLSDIKGLPDWMSDPRDAYGNKKPKLEIINVLGLHRPFFEADFNKQLSGDTARQLYTELESTVRDELASFGVPAALIDRMMRTSSSKIDRIDRSTLGNLMPWVDPWFEEWRLSKCGKLTKDEDYDLTMARFNKAMHDKGLEGSSRQYSQTYVEFLQNREQEIDGCMIELLVTRQSEVVLNTTSTTQPAEN